MVKLTIVGRAKDGMPLSQGPVYVNEDSDNFWRCKQQAEFILKQISAGFLSYSNTTILADHYCFNYLVENGVCVITLCDSSYPRKLAFHYLQDLQKEFNKLDNSLIHKITRPYSFAEFGNPYELSKLIHVVSLACLLRYYRNKREFNLPIKIYEDVDFVFFPEIADSAIRTIRRQYIDTRTQANLSILNSKQEKQLDVITLHMSQILETRRTSEISERMQETSRTVSPIWSSPSLEVIALKWTPITIIVVVASVLLWASFILGDDFIIRSF